MTQESIQNDEIYRLKKNGYSLIGFISIILIILILKKSFSFLFFILFFLFLFLVLQTLKYPQSLAKTECFLIKIGAVLGWINTRIILIFLFYFIITPISLLIKIFGKDEINERFDKDKQSYWINNSSELNKETLKRQF